MRVYTIASPTVVREDSGFLWNASCRFNWFDAQQTSEALKRMGLEQIALYGIGCLSGIKYDPLSTIVRPSQLREDEREGLLEAELSQGQRMPEAGRYMLAVARRAR